MITDNVVDAAQAATTPVIPPTLYGYQVTAETRAVLVEKVRIKPAKATIRTQETDGGREYLTGVIAYRADGRVTVHPRKDLGVRLMSRLMAVAFDIALGDRAANPGERYEIWCTR